MKGLPPALHQQIVSKVYQQRGYKPGESEETARWATYTSQHGVHSHNALKGLHLEAEFGSKVGGCKPGAEIKILPSRFQAVQKWDANYKLGQPVAGRALQTAIDLAEEFGIGSVIIDNAFHYLWGGGYVLYAADKGYIAYTCCTSSCTQVIPYGGRQPTLGTNPHSWAFPTKDQIGYSICIDWATSKIAMGTVEKCRREGEELPPACALDEIGELTTDPNKVSALLPFGEYKGYSLGLINELMGAVSGASLPTLRGRFSSLTPGEKGGATFFFQVIHPEALDCGSFACGRSQATNIKVVLDDILGEANQGARFPGYGRAQAARLSERYGCLLFTEAEIGEFKKLAGQVQVELGEEDIKKIEE